MSVDRYAQCDDTCTVDCGACKGAGRPSAPTPPEVREAAVREQVIEAMSWAETFDDGRIGRDGAAELLDHYLATYRATQDGGAEEAVRRVEAVATIWEGVANTWQETADHPNTGPEFRVHCLAERDDFRDRVTVLRAAIGDLR